MKRIRKQYGVPIRRGGRVKYTGEGYARYGTVVSAKEDNRIQVRLDGENKARLFHPTWKLEYLKGDSEGKAVRPGRAACHPARLDVGNGLCAECHVKAHADGVPGMAAECHPEKPHYSRGLCGDCYAEQYREWQRGPRAACCPQKDEYLDGLCRQCYKAAEKRRKAERRRK